MIKIKIYIKKRILRYKIKIHFVPLKAKTFSFIFLANGDEMDALKIFIIIIIYIFITKNFQIFILSFNETNYIFLFRNTYKK